MHIYTQTMLHNGGYSQRRPLDKIKIKSSFFAPSDLNREMSSCWKLCQWTIALLPSDMLVLVCSHFSHLQLLSHWLGSEPSRCCDCINQRTGSESLNPKQMSTLHQPKNQLSSANPEQTSTFTPSLHHQASHTSILCPYPLSLHSSWRVVEGWVSPTQ